MTRELSQMRMCALVVGGVVVLGALGATPWPPWGEAEVTAGAETAVKIGHDEGEYRQGAVGPFA